MAGSAADAISPAIERSKQLLFPFKAEKWFALGFTVFLARCSEGGSSSFQFPTSGIGKPTPAPAGPGAFSEFQRLLEAGLRALRDDLLLYSLLGAGAFLIGLAVWTFVLWFSSRAKLMFVESVVWDRVDVSAQWPRAAELGFSLFKFRAAVTFIGGVLMLAAAGAAIVVALPDWRTSTFLGPHAIVGYSVLAASFLLLAVPLGITLALLDDFVVPLMVVRNTPVTAAWRVFRAEVAAGNVGGILLFYVLRFVLGLAIAVAVAILTCATCCLTSIPYLGTVILLPIWVFSRAYPLYYLEQLGLRIFPQPEPAWAHYEQWRFPQ